MAWVGQPVGEVEASAQRARRRSFEAPRHTRFERAGRFVGVEEVPPGKRVCGNRLGEIAEHHLAGRLATAGESRLGLGNALAKLIEFRRGEWRGFGDWLDRHLHLEATNKVPLIQVVPQREGQRSLARGEGLREGQDRFVWGVEPGLGVRRDLLGLHIDRPTGVGLAVDGGGDGVVGLRMIGPCPGEAVGSFAQSQLGFAEHEVAVARPARPLGGERVIGEGQQPDSGDLRREPAQFDAIFFVGVRIAGGQQRPIGK